MYIYIYIYIHTYIYIYIYIYVTAMQARSFAAGRIEAYCPLDVRVLDSTSPKLVYVIRLVCIQYTYS